MVQQPLQQVELAVTMVVAVVVMEQIHILVDKVVEELHI